MVTGWLFSLSRGKISNVVKADIYPENTKILDKIYLDLKKIKINLGRSATCLKENTSNPEGKGIRCLV